MITSPKKTFLFYSKIFVEPFSYFFEIAGAAMQAHIPLMRKADGQMPPCQRITAGAKGCPIQAISRFLSLVLMCETGQCCVAKSLCQVFWPTPVDFRSMHDSNLTSVDDSVNCFARFQEFTINNTALVPPDTKHDFFCRSDWVLVLMDRFRWGTATIFSTLGYQNKSIFHHQSQFGRPTEMTFFLGVEAVFHK